MTLEEKRKKLQKLRLDAEKKFGKGALINANEVEKVTFYSTGVPSLDTILSGGVCCGRLFSVYGEYSSGKSSFALQTIAYNQKINEDFTALYVDQESSFDKDYAKALGVDLERIDVIPSDEAEKNLDLLRTLINEGVYNIIVLDSTNTLVPQAELSKDISSNGTIAIVAKLLSLFSRMILGPLAKTKTSLICIEQTRDRLGAMAINGVVPQKVGVGKSISFNCSQRLELKRGKPIEEGDVTIGNYVKAKCVKNKVGKPFAKVEVPMVAGKGFDVELDNQIFVINSGIVERLNNVKWSYTTANGEVIEIKGKDNIIPTLKEKGLFEEAFERAKEKVFEHTDTNSEYEGIDLLEEQNKKITTEEFDDSDE